MPQNVSLCLGSLLFIIVGLVSIFSKDIMWELTAWQHRMKGIASERTESWDKGATFGGVLLLILGALGFFILFNSGV